MADTESDYFEVQESCFTSIQPIHEKLSADYETTPIEEIQDYSTYPEPLDDANQDENIYQDPRDDANSYLEFPLDDATNNDSTNQERLQTPNIRQRRFHSPNIQTNYDTVPNQVSETSPSKRIMIGLLISLIGLFIGVILALVLAAFSIAIARGDDCLEACHNGGSCRFGFCHCLSGFTGEFCEIKACKIPCMHEGTCVNGTCECPTGFTGEACHEPDCLEACHNGGSCRFGFCRCMSGFTGEFCEIEGQDQQRGTGSSSYIRWGRSGCPANADITYTGYAAGTNWNHNGSGANYLCLHETPEYDTPVPDFDSGRARIDGVEYRVSNFPPFASQHKHDMNCAVCRVATRGTMVMIPAKITCPLGWTREYFGYLMSSHLDHQRTEFICVDRNPEAVQGTHESESGSEIFPVEVRCLDPDPAKYVGGLPCDKFPGGNELSCVVCTK